MTPHLDLRICSTAPAREAVYRFRERVAASAPVDLLPAAAPSAVGLQDTLDPMAVLVAVVDRERERILASVRTNLLREGGIPLYPELYGLRDLSASDWCRSAVTTCRTLAPEAVVAEQAGDPSLATLLAWALYDFHLRERICHDFLDCDDRDMPFFVKLGYRRIRAIDHPSRGPSNLMRLDIYDWTHLAEINSPFLTLARETIA